MHFIKNNPIALAVSLAVAATAHTSTAFSQEEEAMLEEVMVTARKREESLSQRLARRIFRPARLKISWMCKRRLPACLSNP